MRLLRTTTTDKTGLFNAFLNQDLVIKPYSKIALGSLSATAEQDEIVIDSNTKKFTFETSAGVTRTISIPQDIYNTTNFQFLLDEMTRLINSSIGVFSAGVKPQIANGNNIGKQMQVIINKQGKTEIQFKQAPSYAHIVEVTGNAYQGGLSLASGTTEDTYRLQSIDDTLAPAFTRATYFNTPICSGVGVLRARIAKLGGSAAGGDLGFTIALMSKNPANIIGHSHGRALAVTDFAFGIQISNPFTGKYTVIEDGVPLSDTDSGDINCANNVSAGGQGTNFRNNDVLSIEICSGVIRLVVYQNDAGGGGPPHVRVLKSIPYEGINARDYYGVIALHGKSSNLNISTIKFTANPYEELPALLDIGVDEVVGASTPSGQGTVATISKITFPYIGFANWLGYKQISYTGPNTKKLVSFVAEDRFKSAILNDLYLLELLNLQLESYDTFEEGRKNILALIPYDDSNSKVSYDPNNLIFLDLNNKESINLTSLKMRLVRADYSNPDISGLTSAVIYIKGKDEV